MEQVREELKGIAGKARTQIVKDYIAFPALSGLIMGGIAAATEAVRQSRAPRRRVPRGVRGRLPARLAPPGRRRARRRAPSPTPGWRVQALLPLDPLGRRDRERDPQLLVERDHLLRPLPRPDLHLQRRRRSRTRPRAAGTCASSLGAANIEGGPFFHVASGNLGYQVEHHLFPDMPSTRYGEIAPKVRDVCKRYGLPYNTGPFSQAVGLGAADDPAARVPGRQAAAEARPVPGRRHRGRPGREPPTGRHPRQPSNGDQARARPRETSRPPRRSPRTASRHWIDRRGPPPVRP